MRAQARSACLAAGLLASCGAESPEPAKPPTPTPVSPAESPVPSGPPATIAWPVAQPHVTSPFGWRTDPVDGRGEQLHRGVDLRGAPGDLVGAIAPGVVEFAGTDPLLGNLVIVDHGQDLRSLYGHLQDLLVHEGLPVDRATTLGLVGNTGRSQAPHLHLSVTVHGVHIDPLRVIGQPFHVPELLVQAAVLAGKALEADQGLGQPSAAHDP